MTEKPFRWYCFYAWERFHPEEYWESEESFMDRIVWC